MRLIEHLRGRLLGIDEQRTGSKASMLLNYLISSGRAREFMDDVALGKVVEFKFLIYGDVSRFQEEVIEILREQGTKYECDGEVEYHMEDYSIQLHNDMNFWAHHRAWNYTKDTGAREHTNVIML